MLTATREQLDLRDQAEVSHWFKANRPEYVFLVAGTVGGIMANSTRPAEFIYDNMMIHGTVVHASHLYDVTKLLYLGSSCIYPRQATQPITEEQLLTGPLEPTNEWYAIAKIAGIKLCQAYRQQYGCDFISAMPTNLYGPNDNFDLTSRPRAAGADPQVPRRQGRPARPRSRSGAPGAPIREFLHVDDLADACLHLMEHYSDDSHINVGTGVDLSIRELAEKVRDLVYPDAELRFDTLEARRHAAQGAGRQPPRGDRLAANDRSRHRHRDDLPVVPRPAGRAPRAARHACRRCCELTHAAN